MLLRITVVVCTRNRAAELRSALDSLVIQTLPRDQYEVVVVDNASDDKTPDVVRGHRSAPRYIVEPRLGLCHARNAGWQAAHGEYVAYLDDDAIADRRWLQTLLETFDRVTPTPGCVGGRVQPLWQAPQPNWLDDKIARALTIIEWGSEPHPLVDLSREWLAGANLALPRRVLEEVGGFVTGLDRVGNRLLSSGDIYLQKQVAALGYLCYYEPGAMVDHLVPRARLSRRWFLRRYFWQGVSDALVRMRETEAPVTLRWRWAATELGQFVKAPHRLLELLVPTADGRAFKRRCYTMARLGFAIGFFTPGGANS
jgi:glucosyl-dolichyl phosphate glucuronosyltransferase